MAFNFGFKDFSKATDSDGWSKYTLNKECGIFGRTLGEKLLEILIHHKNSLGDFIPDINEYLNWLDRDCKERLIQFYNENGNEGEEATDEWYETLEIYRVLITIAENGKLFADISCGDNYWEDHVLDIEIEEKTITSMSYDG